MNSKHLALLGNGCAYVIFDDEAAPSTSGGIHCVCVCFNEDRANRIAGALNDVAISNIDFDLENVSGRKINFLKKRLPKATIDLVKEVIDKEEEIECIEGEYCVEEVKLK